MLQQLSPNIYYMPHDHGTDRPALGLIVGTRQVLMIDAGNSTAHAEAFFKACGDMGLPRPSLLALTHWHWDHVFGADFLSLPTIAHAATQDKLREMAAYTWDDESLDARVRAGLETPFCAENIKKEFGERRGIRIRLADILFDTHLTVSLGGRRCEIFHLGGEHSPDCSVAYCPEERVMFLGDGLCEEMSRGDWSYDLADFRARVQKLRQFPCDWYVNAHWAPQTGEEFWAYCDRLCDLGAVVGGILDHHYAEIAFVEQYGKTPTDDERKLLCSFVNGNRKRLARR